MPNSLGLDNDLDPVEVVRHLERTFDIKVSDAEVANVHTVGQFYDLLLNKIPANQADRKCATAMAFYRLKIALQKLGYGNKINSAFDMRILGKRQAKRNFAKLALESGLRMPLTASTQFWRRAALGIFVLILAASIFLQPSFFAVLFGLVMGSITAAVILMFVDPQRVPENCSTLGGAARIVARANYGRLVKLGARHTNDDIWEQLTGSLSHYALPKAEITKETFFLRSDLEKIFG